MSKTNSRSDVALLTRKVEMYEGLIKLMIVNHQSKLPALHTIGSVIHQMTGMDAQDINALCTVFLKVDPEQSVKQFVEVGE